MSRFKLPEKPARDVESWVAGDNKTVQATKPQKATPESSPGGKAARLTIDLPPDLHGRFKAACALKGTRMIDQVRGFIEEWTQKNS